LLLFAGLQLEGKGEDLCWEERWASDLEDDRDDGERVGHVPHVLQVSRSYA